MTNVAVRWTQSEMKTVVLSVAGPHQSQAIAVFPVGKQWEGLTMHTALGLGSRAQQERWGLLYMQGGGWAPADPVWAEAIG